LRSLRALALTAADDELCWRKFSNFTRAQFALGCFLCRSN